MEELVLPFGLLVDKLLYNPVKSNKHSEHISKPYIDIF